MDNNYDNEDGGDPDSDASDGDCTTTNNSDNIDNNKE